MKTATAQGIVVAKPALDRVRRDRDLTVRGAAARAGLPVSTVAHLFAAAAGRGPNPRRGRVGYATAARLAAALDAPLGDLFRHPNGDPIQGDRE
ncbi:hypothetical protein [Brachybacterium nesterenkovii]|uniref:hypothetical protein n=1 Tax=Brachybacterium nesterenkovii TaxID=47847 RepID=UPI003219F514